MKKILIGAAALVAGIIAFSVLPANGEASKGASQPWVIMRIAQSETNIVNVISSNITAKLATELDSGVSRARQVLSDPTNTNAVEEAISIMLQAADSTAEAMFNIGCIL